MLQLSQRDRDRLMVVREMASGRITVRRGSELMGLSRRQAQRLVSSYRREGDGAVVHKSRGRPPNNRKPSEWRRRVLERAGEAVFAGFGPTLLAEHLSRDPAIGPVAPHTLRRWMIEAGLWKARRHRPRHRKARPRRAAYGELIQWDSSDHAWLEDRVPGRLTLIQMHDDATNRLQMARFVPRDDGPSNRQMALDYLRRHGRPVAFYTDQAGHFGQWTRPVSEAPLEEREKKPTQSIIRRALGELNVELILAHSPQAKGRVERNFGTSQDRLVKELRVAGITTLAEANRFLEDVYIPYWNARFAVEPAEGRNAHRRLSRRTDLEALFADTLTRSIREDFTIRYQNRLWQIPKAQARGIRPGRTLTIERRLDGSTRFRFQARYLTLEPVPIRAAAEPSPKAPATATPASPKTRPSPPRPGPDHPWRTNGALLAKPALIARLRRPTPAAPQPAPSTPRP